jgi:hypothetical protein
MAGLGRACASSKCVLILLPRRRPSLVQELGAELESREIEIEFHRAATREQENCAGSPAGTEQPADLCASALPC